MEVGMRGLNRKGTTIIVMVRFFLKITDYEPL